MDKFRRALKIFLLSLFTIIQLLLLGSPLSRVPVFSQEILFIIIPAILFNLLLLHFGGIMFDIPKFIDRKFISLSKKEIEYKQVFFCCAMGLETTILIIIFARTATGEFLVDFNRAYIDKELSYISLGSLITLVLISFTAKFIFPETFGPPSHDD